MIRDHSPHDAPLVSLTTDPGTTPTIDKPEYSRGTFWIRDDSPVTQITFYGSKDQHGTFRPQYEEVGDGTYRICKRIGLVAGRGYEMPACVHSIPFLKMLPDQAGDVEVFFSA